MFRRRRPTAARQARSHALAALALASGSVGSLVVSQPAAQAHNHGLFSRGQHATQAMVVTPTAFPVLATSSYTVFMPTVATSYVIAPTVQVVPTVWYTTTSLLLPMETECASGEVLQPAAPVAGNVPELQEIPKETKPSASPQEKPPAANSSTAEPPFNPGSVSPPVAPLAKPATKTPPAAKPADAPAAKDVESKPTAKKDEPKPELPPELPENVNPLPPAKPKVTASPDLPPNNPPAAKPAGVKPPAAIDLPPNDVPPAKPLEKPAVPPTAKPAEKAVEKPKDTLVPPPAAEIPLPEAEVPKLEAAEPPPGVKPPAAPILPPPTSGPKDKPPVTEETTKKIDLPPPATTTKPVDLPKPAELPKSIDLPKPADEKPAPVIPLPDIPPPANGELPALPPAAASLPVPELKEETGRKPTDPGAIKAGSESTGTQIKNRESLRPVISNNAKPAMPKPELAISVKSKATGLAEKDVRVLFREPQAGTIKFQANSGASGRSSLEVPEGRWEVLVESPGGTLYVLGELISAQGRVTTASGRALPVLEINR